MLTRSNGLYMWNALWLGRNREQVGNYCKIKLIRILAAARLIGDGIFAIQWMQLTHICVVMDEWNVVNYSLAFYDFSPPPPRFFFSNKEIIITLIDSKMPLAVEFQFFLFWLASKKVKILCFNLYTFNWKVNCDLNLSFSLSLIRLIFICLFYSMPLPHKTTAAAAHPLTFIDLYKALSLSIAISSVNCLC